MSVVACIGTGTVGSGWATVFARAGHSVVLYDKDPVRVRDTALPTIRQTLTELQKHLPIRSTVDQCLDRISIAPSLHAAVEKADYVQESVREDLDIKRRLFTEIAKASPRSCLLASSTSAIPGSDFLSDIEAPERAFVAHPVNPPSHIPLVELCGTGHTGASELEAARRFLTDAGMEPVTLNKEIEGFILNRLQYTLVAEAMHLVGEGYCTAEDIDRVMTSGLALRWATIGPFMTAHLNAADGFAGFVEQLGPMMKQIGKSAVTHYDWDDQQIEEIHDWLARVQPVNRIPEAQKDRNLNILAARHLQQQGPH